VNTFSLKPACFFHPLTTVFLDDTEAFLDAICYQLSAHEKIIAFTNPEKALAIINADSDTMTNAIFKSYNDVDSDHPSIKHIDLNIGHIRNAIYDAERFNHIGVLFVDYHMPEITGVHVCRLIVNRDIYKVLLTAEASLDIAVEAFNEGIIDKFVSKNNSDLINYLSGIIFRLKEEYFHRLSTSILSNLSSTLNDTLKATVFIELFNNIFHQSNAVEYYLLDASGSYLFLDKSGFPTWLIIRHAQDFYNQIDILSGLEASPDMIKCLEDRTQLLFLLDENEYQQSIDEWHNSLFDAKPLTDSVWYAIGKGPLNKSIAWNEVKSYQGSK
jgi:CheY-like chemotaxis protein